MILCSPLLGLDFGKGLHESIRNRTTQEGPGCSIRNLGP